MHPMPDLHHPMVIDPSVGPAAHTVKPGIPSTDGELPSAAILRSIALGAVAGMRSMTPLALLSAASQSPDTPVARVVARMGILRHLRSRGALVGFALAAAGELLADKLPFVPARISFGPLVGRIAVGATAGAIASSASGGSAVRGARRGAAAATTAAFAGYLMRTRLSRRTPVLWAVAEDLTALGLGVAALLPSLRRVVASVRSPEGPR
jgi:uncharacterized membrane protein